MRKRIGSGVGSTSASQALVVRWSATECWRAVKLSTGVSSWLVSGVIGLSVIGSSSPAAAQAPTDAPAAQESPAAPADTPAPSSGDAPRADSASDDRAAPARGGNDAPVANPEGDAPVERPRPRRTGTPMDQPPAGEVKLEFSFRYAPWKDVLEWFAEQADLSLIAEASPPGTFNYTDTKKFTPGEALDLLNGVLITKGYRLVRRERMLLLMNVEDPFPEPFIEQIRPDTLDQRGEFEFVSCLFDLTRITPEAADVEVQKLKGRQGTVVVLPSSKQILVTDTVGRLRTVRDVLRAIEHPEATNRQVKSLPLRYVTPQEALSVLRPLLSLTGEDNATTDGSLRVAVDPRGRNLVVDANRVMLERVESVLAIVDQIPSRSLEETPNLEVYSTGTIAPDAVMKVLQTLLAGERDVRMEIEPTTGNLIVQARPAQHATVQATLDQMSRDARTTKVVNLRYLETQVAVLAINKMFGGGDTPSLNAPKVEGDATNKQLIIRATPAQIAQIEALLTQMGEPVGDGATSAAAGSGRGNIRVLPYTSTQIDSLLEQAQGIWANSGRANRIREVTPSGVGAALRSGSGRVRQKQPDSSTTPRNGADPAGPATDEEPLFGPAPSQLPDLPATSPRSSQLRRAVTTHYVQFNEEEDDNAGGNGSLGGGVEPAPVVPAPASPAPVTPVPQPAVVEETGEPAVAPNDQAAEVASDQQAAAVNGPAPAEDAGNAGQANEGPAAAEAQDAAGDPPADQDSRDSGGNEPRGNEGPVSGGDDSSDAGEPAPRTRRRPGGARERAGARGASGNGQEESQEPSSQRPARRPRARQAVSPLEQAAETGNLSPAQLEALRALGVGNGSDNSGALAADNADPDAPVDPDAPADIIISRGPNGLIIASDDPRALDEFEQLLSSLEEAAIPSGSQYTVFYLKHAKAATASELLNQVITGGTGSSAPSLGGDLFSSLMGAGGSALIGSGLQIVPDSRLNLLIVQGLPAELALLEDLLKVIDQPFSGIADLIPKPRLIPIANGDPEQIANVVRQVFASRIAGGQGGGGQQGGQRQASPQEFIEALRGAAGGGGGRGGRGGARGGAASDDQMRDVTIGVDTVSRSLVVAAPDPIFEQIKDLVTQLDQAGAGSGEVLQVVPVKRSNPETVQRAVAALIGQQVTNQRGQNQNNQNPFGGQNQGGFNQGGFNPGGLDQLRNNGFGGQGGGFGGQGGGRGGFGGGFGGPGGGGFGGPGGGFGGQGGGRGGFGGQGGGGFGGQGGGGRGGQGGGGGRGGRGG